MEKLNDWREIIQQIRDSKLQGLREGIALCYDQVLSASSFKEAKRKMCLLMAGANQLLIKSLKKELMLLDS